MLAWTCLGLALSIEAVDIDNGPLVPYHKLLHEFLTDDSLAPFAELWDLASFGLRLSVM